MVLSSSAYFIFLVGVFFLYWPVARYRALSLAVILFANYFFYAKWDLFYLALIPAASTCDFLIALSLQHSKAPWLRRALVTLSVLLNIGILVSFKYMAAPPPSGIGFSRSASPSMPFSRSPIPSTSTAATPKLPPATSPTSPQSHSSPPPSPARSLASPPCFRNLKRRTRHSPPPMVAKRYS